MNFLIQAYGSSVLDERTNRRGEPLLVTPLSPVDIVAGRRSRTSRSRRSSRRSSQPPAAGALSVIAVLPVALTFLAATFVGAMFARSFKELTFVTVGVSVLLTTYAFVPAIFTNVTPVALVSPLTLVVFDLQGEAVGNRRNPLLDRPDGGGGGAPVRARARGLPRGGHVHPEAGRAEVPRCAGGATLGYIGKPNSGGRSPRERLRALAPIAFLTACTIPFVFVAELLAVALLFALPVTVSIPVLLVTIAFIEELAKSIHLYAGFERGAFARTDRVAVAVGTASAVGFFLAEKATAVVQAVGLTELYVGRAAFGSVAGMEGLPPIAIGGGSSRPPCFTGSRRPSPQWARAGAGRTTS